MRPRLLFISPVWPTPSGGGLSMRAWYTLRALAVDHEVHLLVAGTTPSAAPRTAELPVAEQMVLPRGLGQSSATWIRRVVRRAAPSLAALAFNPPEWAGCDARARAAIGEFICGKRFAVQHAFRLYMAPVAEAVRGLLPGIPTQLDLDDLEFETRMSVAALHARRGERGPARLARRQAEFYRNAAAVHLPCVHRVWVCSELDHERIRRAFPSTPAAVVPNTAPPPAALLSPPSREPFTFLFVGGLGYFPNLAGVEWLVREVLPLLRRMTATPFRVRIVGGISRSHPPGATLSMRDVEWMGFAEDLASHYAAASAVVVPIHAGGGTRIKAIEAFAHRRPVVSTPVGVEGLDVRHGVQALVAADAAQFAEQCLRLMEQPELAAALASSARALYDQRYTPAAVECAVRQAMAIGPTSSAPPLRPAPVDTPPTFAPPFARS